MVLSSHVYRLRFSLHIIISLFSQYVLFIFSSPQVFLFRYSSPHAFFTRLFSLQWLVIFNFYRFELFSSAFHRHKYVPTFSLGCRHKVSRFTYRFTSFVSVFHFAQCCVHRLPVSVFPRSTGGFSVGLSDNQDEWGTGEGWVCVVLMTRRPYVCRCAAHLACSRSSLTVINEPACLSSFHPYLNLPSLSTLSSCFSLCCVKE